MTVAVIGHKELGKALQAVKPACKAKSPLTVLRGVRVAFRGDRMTIEATDLDRSITVNVPLSEGGGASGETVVPLEALQGALEFRTGAIELSIDDGGCLRVSTDESSSTVSGLDLADWPRIDEPAQRPFKVTETMAAAIRKVAVAASEYDDRPVLTGIYFDRGYIVATDSYRLAAAGPFQPVAPMLVRADQLVAAVAAGSEIAYDPGLNKAMVLTGTTETIIHCIEGKFPTDWRRLDAAKPVSTLRFSRDAAVATLKRAEKVVRKDQTIPVRLSRPDAGRTIHFDITDGLGGKVIFHEEVAGIGDVPEDVIAFNPTFLRQGCEACTGKSIEMWFTEGNKPAKIVDGFFTYLIMPVRIR